ncbi:hypothetical protein SNEBB_009881 [Seison nebaliae]|nr:hypothetical protein SNEBB_009881 [Seison nebaliae]
MIDNLSELGKETAQITGNGRRTKLKKSQEDVSELGEYTSGMGDNIRIKRLGLDWKWGTLGQHYLKSTYQAKRLNRLTKKMILSLVLILFILFLLIKHNKIPDNVRIPGEKYAVIIDAGSTGSRLHAFHFIQDPKQFPSFVLVNDFFKPSKPGLSAFAHNIPGAVESIEKLMMKANNHLPRHSFPNPDCSQISEPFSCQKNVPLTLKATAGLRLLPAHAADDILDALKHRFAQTTYFLDNVNESAEILNSKDEGIFAWITINYLLHKLHNSKETVAILDLGGGSGQITFAHPHRISDNAQRMVQYSFFGKNFQLFSHSYLGLGLMISRFHILVNGESEKTSHHQCLIGNGHFFYQTSKIFGEYRVIDDRVMKCDKEIVQYIMEMKRSLQTEYLPENIRFNEETVYEQQKTILHSFSYTYDVAVDAGLVPERSSGKLVRPIEFYKKAKELCNSVNQDHPFLCFDLLYVYNLFTKVAGIDDRSPIYICKQIDNTEISWALGAAFNLLSKQQHFSEDDDV